MSKSGILITGDQQDKLVILKALGNPYVNLENREWVVRGEGDTIALRAKLQKAFMWLEKEVEESTAIECENEADIINSVDDVLRLPYVDKLIYGKAEAEIVEGQ
jgi:hypothetical protein